MKIRILKPVVCNTCGEAELEKLIKSKNAKCGYVRKCKICRGEENKTYQRRGMNLYCKVKDDKQDKFLNWNDDAIYC